MEFYIEIPDFPSPKDATTILYGTDWRNGLTGVQLVNADFPKVRKLRSGWKVVSEEP
ncbi:hypothetical protein BGX30_005870, partial [Mortierella sp. GBA39]